MKTLSFHDLKVGRGAGNLLLELNSERQGNALKAGLNLIVAPNGRGKTTLLQTIAGVLGARGSGLVKLDGQKIDPERDVLYVSEYLTFPSFIYPSEWIDFVGGPTDLASLDRWIDGFSLRPLMKKFLGRMSQGERRKVTWLGAQASKKPVLLLDEPLDGLDLLAIKTAREMIETWKREGRILLVVAHQVGEVLDLADEVFLIQEQNLLPWAKRFPKSWREMSAQEFRAAVLQVYS